MNLMRTLKHAWLLVRITCLCVSWIFFFFNAKCIYQKISLPFALLFYSYLFNIT